MRFDIFWTDEAKETFNIIITTLEINWGEHITANFVSETYKKIALISINPYLYQASFNENVRRAVISKNSSMVYEIAEGKVIILFFYDNRQEPIF